MQASNPPPQRVMQRRSPGPDGSAPPNMATRSMSPGNVQPRSSTASNRSAGGSGGGSRRNVSLYATATRAPATQLCFVLLCCVWSLLCIVNYCAALKNTSSNGGLIHCLTDSITHCDLPIVYYLLPPYYPPLRPPLWQNSSADHAIPPAIKWLEHAPLANRKKRHTPTRCHQAAPGNPYAVVPRHCHRHPSV